MRDDTLILYFHPCFKTLIDPLSVLEDKFISFDVDVPKLDMFIFKVLRKLHIVKEINKKFYWNKKWKSQVSSIKNWIFFVRMSSNDEKKVVRYILSKNPSAKFFFYSWDIKFAIKKDTFNVGRSGTFDDATAQNEGIECWGQFANDILFKKLNKNDTKTEFDYMFIGQDKGRREIVNSIDEELKNAGYKGKILIGKGFSVSYLEYLDYLQKSKCVMDITQETQSGITLRVMESLFFGKKLISNNSMLKKYDFYNPKNIFIIGKNNKENDSGRSIKEFLEEPYVEISDEIKNRYTFESFINRIIES